MMLRQMQFCGLDVLSHMNGKVIKGPPYFDKLDFEPIESLHSIILPQTFQYRVDEMYIIYVFLTRLVLDFGNH